MAAEGAGLLANERVLVTGASGIGAAVVRRCVAEGARVLVADRDAARLEALRTAVPAVVVAAGDLADESVAREAVERAQVELGGLDVLVNVAGLSGRRFGDGPVHEASAAGWEAVMWSNARSTFLMCRFALGPMLRQRRGAIVNTGSVLAYAPSAEHFATHAYAASKGAIHALTRSMAAAYASAGVRVNAVAPGLIATPMTERARSDPATSAYVRERQPLGAGPGRPEDVAAAIVYLASSGAALVTGTILEVAGGWSVAR
jgi:NAD(P)-dependent dehydrogenase (short-subunit alcohol dehydrogenase family)